jgi:hypothetical protein
MVSFNTAYQLVVDLGRDAGRDAVTPEVEPLLRQLYESLEQQPVSVANVNEAVVELLRYLTTPAGRTNANCWAVDLFMTEDWGPIDHDIVVGQELADVLADMGGALHDTIHYPDVASEYESTPEQLLQRVLSIVT